MADITKSNVTIRYRTEYGQTPSDKTIIANESLTLEHLPILSAENHTFVKWVHVNEAGHESSLSERMIISTEWLIPSDSADKFYVIFTAKWKTKPSSGSDATSITHEWDGTTLIVTSASGTSSADLKGKDGEDGESAYQYAVDGGYTGTEEEFTELLLGNHEHDASAITSGTLPLSRGGTGRALTRTSNALIRFSSGSDYFSTVATKNGALYATSSNGSPAFGTLPIAQGGTGATTAEGVLTNLGLGNVDNTSDAEKPISTATQAALNAKANADAVPTKTSQLTNDSGFLTQHQDISGKANASDLTAHTGDKTAHITSEERTAWNNKAGDFTILLYNGNKGNPQPVRFASFNYSTCTSENGIAAKISMVSGHGNGTSYAFLQDAIIKVNHQGSVSVDNFKYYGADAGTYDGAARQYGDIFWLVDETNKIVDFYCLMGQYSRVYQTPWKRLTYSTGGTVTQHTSCTIYSSGDKAWANNSEIAVMSDIPTDYLPLSGGTMTGELKVNGGDVAGGSKIVFVNGKGQITASGTQTLFGFTANSTIAVGHGSFILAARGSETRLKYNSKDVALMNDLNRSTAVNAEDTNYTTLMARGTSLNSAETNPAVNGAIAWTYE